MMNWIAFSFGVGILLIGSYMMYLEYRTGIADGSITRPFRNAIDKASWKRYVAEFGIAMGGFWIARSVLQGVVGMELSGFVHMLYQMVPVAISYFGVQTLLWKYLKTGS